MIVVVHVLLLKVMINRCRTNEGSNNQNNPAVNHKAERESPPVDIQDGSDGGMT